MHGKTFFFVGGGTGGHIYPAIAVAQQLLKTQPEARIHFFCSDRESDAKILSKTVFGYTALPAKGFSVSPKKLVSFFTSFLSSCRIADEIIDETEDVTVIGVGGFVSAPVCWAAQKLNIPVALINVDIVPGKANKLIAYWADEIFLQFEQTAQYFEKRKANVHVVGCPLRAGFTDTNCAETIESLGLDMSKKILLITGASSGAVSVNEAVCSLLKKLDVFADTWQIVHLTGRANFEDVQKAYTDARITAKVIDYCDTMPQLLAAADLLIGRSGAVSVAEYTAAAVPSICMPYPHHKDRHQYLNAAKLVEAGAAVIVDDIPDTAERSSWLWEELEPLMTDDRKLLEMKNNFAAIAKNDAAKKIAQKLLSLNNEKISPDTNP